MSEQTTEKDSGHPQRRRHRLGRRARLAIGAVTLLGAGALLGAGVTAHAERMGSWHGMGHGWKHAQTEEQARERALDKAAWVLGRVDATPDQETRINAIVSELVGDLYPLRGEHREQRRALITELARPEVDPQALDAIRSNTITLADSASKSLVNAVVEVTQVLSVEQREELAAMIARRRH